VELEGRTRLDLLQSVPAPASQPAGHERSASRS
jgi:hypothetical protein